MKRMHALPIELPLVASGEFDLNEVNFLLDKELKTGLYYCIIAPTKEEGTPFSYINGVSIYINAENQTFSQSPAFSVDYGNSRALMYLTFSSTQKNRIALNEVLNTSTPAFDIDFVDGSVIYIYELPLKIDNKVIL